MNQLYRHILLCEDNEEIIMITEFFLHSEGYEVDIARTTEEAQDLLTIVTPQLVLLDLNLPEDGGESILKLLKEDPMTKDIPVILCSGKENLSETASELGADGYLSKPFDLAALMDVILKWEHA